MNTHAESTWVAFSEVTVLGKRWNVTLREGITHQEIDNIIAVLEYATEKAFDSANATVEQPVWERVPETHFELGPEKVQHAGSGGRELINRLVVGGTLDKPTIETYSANPNLKFPFLKAPATQIIRILTEHYPELGSKSTEGLLKCGSTIPVDWVVEWVPSPKNPKWKDIISIVVSKLEEK